MFKNSYSDGDFTFFIIVPSHIFIIVPSHILFFNCHKNLTHFLVVLFKILSTLKFEPDGFSELLELLAADHDGLQQKNTDLDP